MRVSHYLILPPVVIALLSLVVWFFTSPEENDTVGGMSNPQLRAEWEHMLLQDPATGIVPVTRSQELAFAQGLPVYQPAQASRTEYYDWTARGPFNFGGRTRGAAMDVTDGNILIAGSVSGGIYRSEDKGQTWTKTTNNTQNFGITCLVQDTRNGKEHIWYAGSGEAYNSASQGAGARYVGDGMLKSIDSGQTWASLISTQTGTPQSLNDWDRIWRVVVDPTASEDVVLAAITGSIMRSTDGGETWTEVLGESAGSAYYSEISVTSTGVFYATFSMDGGDAGIWRSTDGETWTEITPSGWPSAFQRTVMGINPSDEDEVYFLSETPGSGKQFENFRGDVEYISFWKYSYISGDGTGAGGFWEDRSENLPSGPYRFDDLNLQGGYNMLITVKPDDPETVIIGGTNLFRSTTAFADSTHNTMIGGYDEDTDLPDFQIYENHHPDQHVAFFDPSDPDIMYSANDGGFFRTDDINATPVVWESLNNGYNTTQFYTVGIDHGTSGSNEIIGGLQDNGTFYTNNTDPYDWKFPWSYDGAFVAIGDGGSMHLTSIQLGRMFKLDINSSGERVGFTRFDPDGVNGYYFIHPWDMDPNDNSIVYLPIGARLWRNDQVDQLPFDSHDSTISTGWTQMPFTFSGNASCVGISTANPANRVYVGTSTGKAYRIENANTSTATFSDVSNFLSGGAHMNCIAVDPKDGNHAIAVFSNYNVHSIYFTRDGGESWFRAGGNLEAESAPDGAPEDLYSISTAPSIRWAEIMHTQDGDTVYLIGTSVGLYGTNRLYPGTDRLSDSTTWKQLAPDEIGNTVVMMVDSREADGFVAVATHGAGIFSSHMPHAWGTTAIEEKPTQPEVQVFPNPVSDYVNISTSSPIRSAALMDLSGHVLRKWNANDLSGPVPLPRVASGIYFLVVSTDEGESVEKIMVHPR